MRILSRLFDFYVQIAYIVHLIVHRLLFSLAVHNNNKGWAGWRQLHALDVSFSIGWICCDHQIFALVGMQRIYILIS